MRTVSGNREGERKLSDRERVKSTRTEWETETEKRELSGRERSARPKREREGVDVIDRYRERSARAE